MGIIMLLDSILNDNLWENCKEQQQFILNLYDYLILCIAIDNREVRQRISKLFGGCIKSMLMNQYPLINKKEEEEEQSNGYDNNSNDSNILDINNNDNDNEYSKFEPDTNRIV